MDDIGPLTQSKVAATHFERTRVSYKSPACSAGVGVGATRKDWLWMTIR